MSRVDGWALLKSGASGVALTLALSGAALAGGGLPGHGHYVAGQGSFSKSIGRLTVDQRSQTGIIDWKSFSVGKANSVTFDNGHGATLNEVTGGNLSRIAGQLHATGSLYVINSAGVAVLPTGRVVTTGSFIASGRNADEDAFSSGNKRLLLGGQAKGNVINRGSIQSKDGVGLYGHNVIDSGSLSARNATLIASDRTQVSGNISAQRHVETSGGKLSFSGASITAHNWLIDPTNLTVNASAAKIIDNSLGNGTNVTLKTTASGASWPGKKSSGPGDIIIAVPLTWSTGTMLTLDAYHNIAIDAAIVVKGKGGLTLTDANSDALSFSDGAHVSFANLGSALTINGAAYTLVKNIATLASDIGSNSDGDYALAMNYNAHADGTYAGAPIGFLNGTFEGLGNTISNFTSDGVDAGFVSMLSGTIRDLGLVRVNMTSVSGGGLVDDNLGTIDNSYVTGAISDTIFFCCTSLLEGGGLVGFNETGGTINNSYSTATVKGASAFETMTVGGLVGLNEGAISNSYATGKVSGTFASGGLVGWNQGTIEDSFATDTVHSRIGGGLVGINDWDAGNIVSSYATGAVNGKGKYASVGGLVGANYAAILNCYSTGAVEGKGANADIGGLVGRNWGPDDNAFYNGTISGSYSTGAVSGGSGNVIGGLVGRDDNALGSITNSYWDETTSGITSSSEGAGYPANDSGITGETNAQLTSGLSSGFSSSIWAESASINGGLPYLLNNPPP